MKYSTHTHTHARDKNIFEFILIYTKRFVFVPFAVKRAFLADATKQFARSGRGQEHGRTAAISPVRYII